MSGFRVTDFGRCYVKFPCVGVTVSIHGMANDLSNRVALVTGASRGLGAGISQKLGERGARVAINTFGSPEKAEALAESIRKSGGIARVFRADVRDEQQVAKLEREVREQLGPIDILVLNATGPQPMIKLELMTWRDCLDQLEFFVKSPLILTQAVLGSMKERKFGRIVMIGSEVFEKGNPEFSSYVSAKGRPAWPDPIMGDGIGAAGNHRESRRAGWIPTERHAGDPQAAKDQYAAMVPMKRMGAPEDVAEAVAFLASDAANFITGQRISVNGGNTLE